MMLPPLDIPGEDPVVADGPAAASASRTRTPTPSGRAEQVAAVALIALGGYLIAERAHLPRAS